VGWVVQVCWPSGAVVQVVVEEAGVLLETSMHPAPHTNAAAIAIARMPLGMFTMRI